MLNKNNSNEKTEDIKSLTLSITQEIHNSLSAINKYSNIVKSNLKETANYLKLINNSSNRVWQIADMVLHNIKEGEINQNDFQDLLISNVVQKAVKEYGFELREEKQLININFAEYDFTFKGDETLMISVIFHLLKNSLLKKAKIEIQAEDWTDYNILYFVDFGISGFGEEFSFYQKVMKAFGGKIKCSSRKGEVSEFALLFPIIDK